MKYIKLSILIPFVVMLIVWVTGKMSISEDERKRIKETQYKAFPLFEPIGITNEIQKFTFKVKPHRTSSRYFIRLDFPRADRDYRESVFYKSVDKEFRKNFFLIIENARTGRVLFQHTEETAFRYHVDDYGMLWNIKSNLKLKWGSEYLVHVTMPGIEDAPDELSEIYLLCHIPFRPSL